MMTVKIKNSRKSKEIIAEDIDDAMYKLAQEKKNQANDKNKMLEFLEYIKNNRTPIDKYILTTRDERNER